MSEEEKIYIWLTEDGMKHTIDIREPAALAMKRTDDINTTSLSKESSLTDILKAINDKLIELENRILALEKA